MSAEGIQDTTHYVFTVWSLQSGTICFVVVAFFLVSSLASMYQSKDVQEFHHLRRFLGLSPGAIFISFDACSHKCWILSLDPEREVLAAGKK